MDGGEDFWTPGSRQSTLYAWGWAIGVAVALTAIAIVVLLVAIAVVVGLASAPAAHAMPPAGADPSLAPWFESLAQPETGYPCCSVADCRAVRYRTVGDHFEAFIDRRTFGADAPDDWLPVPPANVLHRRDNPTGEAIACWYGGEIRCFVEGAGI